jgi:hypothetical protein
MTYYGVPEPPTEFLRVVDPLTQGIIYCVNRCHIRQPKWKERFLHGNNVPHIDVTAQKPCKNTLSFIHDSFVETRHAQQYVELLIDYACLMHYHLIRSGSVVVHCKNGRSRSPTVILAFMMLRGISRTHAIAWLNEAFRSQRKAIALRSAEFPNFAKFENITRKLNNSLQMEWLISRVDENFKYISKLSSSSSSSSSFSNPSEYLCGMRWTKPFATPKQWEDILPTTSFCDSLDKYDTATNVSGNTRKRRRTNKKEPEPDPTVNCSGRRVKLFASDKYKSEIVNNFQVGTLISKCENAGPGFWNIILDGNGKEKLVSNLFSPAFPKGTRVRVNWELMGELFDGIVTEWKGGSNYSVWFDLEKRTFTTSGAELLLSSESLPLHASKRIKDLVLNRTILSSSSSSSQTVVATLSSKQNLIRNNLTFPIRNASSSSKEEGKAVGEDSSCTDSSSNLNPTKKRKLMSTSSTRYRGVYPSVSGKRFIAIGHHKKSKYLGTYDTPQEAALAYDRFIIQNNKPKKKLNFLNTDNNKSTNNKEVVEEESNSIHFSSMKVPDQSFNTGDRVKIYWEGERKFFYGECIRKLVLGREIKWEVKYHDGDQKIEPEKDLIHYSETSFEVGNRVKVFWKECKNWFFGHCKQKIANGLIPMWTIKYEDGDERNEPEDTLVLCLSGKNISTLTHLDDLRQRQLTKATKKQTAPLRMYPDVHELNSEIFTGTSNDATYVISPTDACPGFVFQNIEVVVGCPQYFAFKAVDANNNCIYEEIDSTGLNGQLHWSPFQKGNSIRHFFFGNENNGGSIYRFCGHGKRGVNVAKRLCAKWETDERNERNEKMEVSLVIAKKKNENSFGLLVTCEEVGSARIISVKQGTAGARAGLKAGDIINKCQNEIVKDIHHLENLCLSQEKVQILIRRCTGLVPGQAIVQVGLTSK